MPEPAEVRRQRVAYKQQVHELRLQYAKELQAKESKLQEVRKAVSSAPSGQTRSSGPKEVVSGSSWSATDRDNVKAGEAMSPAIPASSIQEGMPPPEK